MGIFKKVVEKLDKVADERIAEVVDKVKPPKPAPKKPPRTNFHVVAGLAVLLVLVGACRAPAPTGPASTTSVVATCDEPVLGRCSR